MNKLLKLLKDRKAFTSLLVTIFIVSLLLMPQPARALQVTTVGLDGASITKGTTYTFYIYVLVEDGERILPETIALSVTGATTLSATFNGVEGGSSNGFTLTPTASLLPPDFGYGYDYGFGYGYGYGPLRAFGYGYGYGFVPAPQFDWWIPYGYGPGQGPEFVGYGYGYGAGYGYGPGGYGYGFPGTQILVYTVTMDTSNFNLGNHEMVISLTVDGSTFVSPPASFSIIPFDFTVTATPTSRTIVRGDSAFYAVSVSLVSGTAEEVALSISGVPSAAEAAFTPSSGTPTYTSTLEVDTSSSTPTSTYTLTISGTSTSGITRTTDVTLTVLAPPVSDFTVTTSPTEMTLTQGETGSATVTVASIGVFSDSVALSAAGQPSGVSTIFRDVTLIPPAGGSASTRLTVVATGTAETGTFPITITGISGGVSKSTTLTLTINPKPSPDFELAVSPDTQSVRQGSSGSTEVTMTSKFGFNSPIDLSVSGLPTGVTVQFSIDPATPPAGGSIKSVLTLNVGAAVAIDSYVLTVEGESDGLTHTDTLTLTVTSAAVPDFSLSVSPSTRTIEAGETGTADVTVTSINGFNNLVTISASGPIPAAFAFSSNPVTPPADGSVTVTFAVTLPHATPAGTYTFTLTGASDSLTKSATFTVTVPPPPPSILLKLKPNALSLRSGETGTSTITLKSLFGFSGDVSLSVSGAPTGTTPTLSPSSVTLTSGGTATSVLTVISTSTPGIYFLTVTATSGDVSSSATLTLKVLPAAPTFQVRALTNRLSTSPGGSVSSVIQVISQNGFTDDVALTATAPTGFTASLKDSTLTPPAGGIVKTTLTISTGSVAPGNYMITITGTSGDIMRRTAVTVTVTATPDFAITARPSLIKATSGVGKVSAVTLRVTSINDFAGSVSLSASGVPSGVEVRPDPISSFSVPADGTVRRAVGVIIRPTALPGTYIISITAASGSLTHTATITLVIS